MILRNPLSDAPEICRLGVDALSRHYANGSLSPVEVLKATIEHAHTVNDRFNAFTVINEETALPEARKAEARWRSGNARSKIDGIPATVKDVLMVEGLVSRWGSRGTENRVSASDAPSVAALRRDGAIVFGITTTPEFGWKGVTDSPLTGVTLNPWDRTLTPGGSSGGAAVAALTGAGVLHVGTDGGGSNRIPASFTGTVGMKPTFGRIPVYPVSKYGTISHVGPIARTVSDVTHMLESMICRDLRDWTQGPDSKSFRRRQSLPLHGLRIGFWDTPACGVVEAEVLSAIARAVADLEKAGASIEPFRMRSDFELLDIFSTLWYSGAAALVRSIPQSRVSELEPGFREIAEAGEQTSGMAFSQAQVTRASFGAWMDAQLESFDFVVSPATAVLPFPAGRDVPLNSICKKGIEWMGFTFPINLSQQPACSIPIGFSESGLPVGMQIIGARGADERLIGFATAVEQLFTS
ncbi:amidase [Burkholderia cenocepacia]|nr:amidase [Burkholderia cenocepacia]